METSPRPKLRPTKRPRLKPSEEEMADIEAGRTIERANRLKKLIEKEAVGLRDKTPLKPIKKFRSRSQDGSKEGTQQFELGGDVRYNTNRGKTY